MWAVDVGGTTTDIARLHDGAPILIPKAPRLGGWQTMVEAVDVRTTGLGGDSYVRLDDELKLLLGPRRVVPLSLLASESARSRDRAAPGGCDPPAKRPLGVGAHVAVAGRQAGARLLRLRRRRCAPWSRGRWRWLPWPSSGAPNPLARRQIESLKHARRLARHAAFTPTDALHVLGCYVPLDAEAVRARG